MLPPSGVPKAATPAETLLDAGLLIGETQTKDG